MTDLEKRILNLISGTNGITGADIAKSLQVEKAEVCCALSQSVELKKLVELRRDYKWYLISAAANEPEEPNGPPPDEDLSNLCNYYLQSIMSESGNSVSQFLSSYEPQYVVLSGLDIDVKTDKAAITLLNRISADNEKRPYLGYPLCIFTIYGKGGKPYKKIAPVFLFPVTYDAGSLEISWVPKLNMEVLQQYCPGHSGALARKLAELETELGMNDPSVTYDVEDLIVRLVQIRQWEWAEAIDPFHIPPPAILEL